MFLLPETVARQDGVGAEVAIGFRVVKLTLGITRSIAQECLEVSICGSTDGEYWETLATFPHKFYCGTYSMVVDLSRRPDVRHLRAEWKMGRWKHEEEAPLFEFYLRAEDALLCETGKVAAYAI